MKYIKILMLSIVIIMFQKVALSGIREFCVDQWPDDYRMIEHCEKEQYEAYEKFWQYAENLGLVKDGNISASSKGDTGESIVFKCMADWEATEFNTYDFRMVVHCMKNQFEAYNRLHPDIQYKNLNKKKIKPVSRTGLDKLEDEGRKLTDEIAEMIEKAKTEDSHIDINSVDELINRLDKADKKIELAQAIYKAGRITEAEKLVSSTVTMLVKTKAAFEEEMHPKNSPYNEPITLAGSNTLYETGTEIKLYNPTDTAVAVYKDSTLKDMITLYTNGIPATIINYRTSPGHPTVYNIRILLENRTNPTGWVPEGAIRK